MNAKPRKQQAPLAGLVLLLVFAVVISWISLPVVAVAGQSMEPTYSSGDLVFVESVSPTEIDEGDVIVVEVPAEIQERYGYPDYIVHRVVDVEESGETITFRTGGDNTGQDPFTVYPENVRGQTGHVVPGAGFVIHYVQSVWGRLFIASLLILELLYHHEPAIRRTIADRTDRVVTELSPAHELEDEVAQLNHRMDDMDDSFSEVHRSLTTFADAMEEYGVHLKSHTSAVQQMGQAAEDIQDSVETQQHFLAQLAEATHHTPTPDQQSSIDETPDRQDRDAEAASHDTNLPNRDPSHQFDFVGDAADRAQSADDAGDTSPEWRGSTGILEAVEEVATHPALDPMAVGPLSAVRAPVWSRFQYENATSIPRLLSGSIAANTDSWRYPVPASVHVGSGQPGHERSPTPPRTAPTSQSDPADEERDTPAGSDGNNTDERPAEKRRPTDDDAVQEIDDDSDFEWVDDDSDFEWVDEDSDFEWVDL